MYAAQSPLIGSPLINRIGLDSAGTVRSQPHGQIVLAADPWFGAGEFMYARANGTIRAFGICQLNPTFDSTDMCWRFEATEAASTAILGRTVCVAQSGMASGDYGWFCVGGVTPVNCNAAVAADATFSIAATGQGGAAATGKQIVNARIIGASTITVAKANCTQVGLSTILTVPNSDGWFEGVYLSGTGVAAGAMVSSISPDGRTVVMSAASTAVIAGTVTATYNNATIYYNIAHINRPFQQGAIT